MTTESEDGRIRRLWIIHAIPGESVEDTRFYGWPDGWAFRKVDDLLVERGFSKVTEPSRTLEFWVEVGDSIWVNEPGGRSHKLLEDACYQFPDGWDIENVRDLLRRYGFQREDNRQDSHNEPNPYI